MLVGQARIVGERHLNPFRQWNGIGSPLGNHPVYRIHGSTKHPGRQLPGLFHSYTTMAQGALRPIEELLLIGVMKINELIIIEFEEDPSERILRPRWNVVGSFVANH